VPSLFTNVVTWTATGATQDVTAAPLSLSDYDRVRRLRWLNGVAPSGYSPMGVANPIDPEKIPYGRDFVFLVRARAPPSSSTRPPPSPGTSASSWPTSPRGRRSTATSHPVVLPDGADYILAQLLAADIRVRFEEDPGPHLAIAAAEWADLRWELQQRYGVHPEGLAEEGME
jgi:hypothetical protein